MNEYYGSDALREYDIKSGADLFDFLFGTNRWEILGTVDDWTSKETILEECGLSESNLAVNAGRMEDLELLVQRGHDPVEYQLTPFGQWIADREIPAAADHVAEFFPLYPGLHRVERWDEVLCDIEWWKDAEIEKNTRLGPNQAMKRYKKAFEQAVWFQDHFHRTIVSNFLLDLFQNDVIDGVFYAGREVFEEARETRSSMENWHQYEAAGAEFYAVDDPLPFTLVLFIDDADDRSVGLFPSDEDETDVFLYAEDDRVVSWTEDVFTRFEAICERVTP